MIFALLPLGAGLLLRALAGKFTTETLANSPEILFFSLMVSATALGDLSELAEPLGWDLTIRVLRSALFLGAMFSAILYGSFLYDRVIGPGSEGFRLRLLQVSAWLAVVFFTVSTIAEILLARIESG